MTEPMSTPDSGGLREAVEALAAEFDSNVDWSAGRNNYGDNEAWESAARQARALLAEHPEPVPTPDSADDDTVAERECRGCQREREKGRSLVNVVTGHMSGCGHPATPDADDTPPPAAGDVDLHAVTLIRDVAGVSGPTALKVWDALAPLLGHIEREAVSRDRATREAASKAEALREAADRTYSDGIAAWLRDRADRIEARP